MELALPLGFAAATASCAGAPATAPSERSESPPAASATSEPPSYAKVFEWDAGHEFPVHYSGTDSDDCDGVVGLEGSAVADLLGGGYDHEEKADVDQVSGAPVSGPEVLNFKYPAGKVGESNGVNMWAWEMPATTSCDIVNASPVEYDEVYIREVRKIYTDRADGTVETFGSGATFKFSHIKGHKKKVDGTNEGFSLTLNVAIDHDRTSQSEFPLTFRKVYADADGSQDVQVYGHNQGSSERIAVGRWHEVEWQFISNTITGGTADANGVARAWIDGELVMEHTGLIFVTPVASHTEEGFQSYDMVTTWSGGPDDVHTHDKGFYVDHVYVSGKRW